MSSAHHDGVNIVRSSRHGIYLQPRRQRLSTIQPFPHVNPTTWQCCSLHLHPASSPILPSVHPCVSLYTIPHSIFPFFPPPLFLSLHHFHFQLSTLPSASRPFSSPPLILLPSSIPPILLISFLPYSFPLSVPHSFCFRLLSLSPFIPPSLPTCISPSLSHHPQCSSPLHPPSPIPPTFPTFPTQNLVEH